MPECIREFIESLQDSERELVISYLDGDPDAVKEILDLLQQ